MSLGKSTLFQGELTPWGDQQPNYIDSVKTRLPGLSSSPRPRPKPQKRARVRLQPSHSEYICSQREWLQVLDLRRCDFQKCELPFVGRPLKQEAISPPKKEVGKRRKAMSSSRPAICATKDFGSKVLEEVILRRGQPSEQIDSIDQQLEVKRRIKSRREALRNSYRAMLQLSRKDLALAPSRRQPMDSKSPYPFALYF